jgi:histidyl-tRNA synthetase
MSFQPPKGTDDITAPASFQWRRLLRAWEDLAERYAYPLVLTPVFEATELFERGIGETSDVVQKQMYTFTDRGGRSVTLRPEGTAGVVRAYLAAGGQGAWKAAYSGPMFRYERPQGGRRRQFWQVGAEYIGVEGPAADAEVIELSARFLAAAGVETELVVNSLGDRHCRPAYLERLQSYLEARRSELTDEHATRLESNPLRVLDCKVCSPALADAPAASDFLCSPCAEHYREVKAALQRLEIPYREDSRLVRGLDYYVRTVFEFLSTTLATAQTALSSGGRYDGLSELLGGRPAPGVGFAAGIDRIVFALGDTVEPSVDVYVVTEGEARPADGLAVAAGLRNLGLRVDLDPEGRSVKAQFRAADRSGAPYTAVLRAPAGSLELRWKDGRAEVPAEEVGTWLRTRLGR